MCSNMLADEVRLKEAVIDNLTYESKAEDLDCALETFKGLRPCMRICLSDGTLTMHLGIDLDSTPLVSEGSMKEKLADEVSSLSQGP